MPLEVSDLEKYVDRSPVTFLQHGLPGSLLVLLGLLIDLCCPDLHLHKKPAFEGRGPWRSTGVLQGNPAVPPEGRADASSSALPHTVFVAQGSHRATFGLGD